MAFVTVPCEVWTIDDEFRVAAGESLSTRLGAAVGRV